MKSQILATVLVSKLICATNPKFPKRVCMYVWQLAQACRHTKSPAISSPRGQANAVDRRSKKRKKRSSMPLALTHESFLQCAVFEVANEIPIASTRTLCALLSPTASPPRTSWVSVRGSIRRWWIVCWAGLQANRLGGIEMTGYPLDRYGYATLLHFHSGRSLASCAHCIIGCLCIKILLL